MKYETRQQQNLFSNSWGCHKLLRLHSPLCASCCNSPQNGGDINTPPLPLMLHVHQLEILCQKDCFSLCVMMPQTLKITQFHLQPLRTSATWSNKRKKCPCDGSRVCRFWSKALNTSSTSQRDFQERCYIWANRQIPEFGEYQETQVPDVK